ncbi:MAG: hypothetical protein ABL311_04530 [Nitratireductor rhodophyticola]|uniref:hypothetical protein n=1 Tax=Nitratireductor rhodophyticola TaxID=2854036 RepID=UPI0032D95888
MNAFDARARRNGFFWIGEFRAGEHGDYKPVMENGETKPFRSAREAREGAHAALIAYMNGNYVSERAKADHRWEAGKLFRAGKRPVEVVKA